MVMTFYTNPMSRGRMVRWLLEEVGQPYDTVLLDFGGSIAGAGYRKLNPMAKVPTLVHDGRVITEVAAICTWMAETFPAAGLMPDDHASFYRWMFFGAGPIEQAMVNTAFGWIPPPEQERRTGYGSLDRVVATVAGHLTGRHYIVGDRFSVADLYVGSQIGWGLHMGSLPNNPALRAYWDGLATRPALLRANALDDALIKKG